MKINDSKSTRGVEKSKKKGKSGASSGVRFADMLKAAGETGKTETSRAVAPATEKHNQYTGGSVPEDARGRGSYLLGWLEELEKDILSGSPTAAVEQLKEALRTEAVDREDLSPALRAVLDEIDLRASVEVAKLEEGKSKA